MELRPLERTEVPFPSNGRIYVTRCEGGCSSQFPLDEIVPEVEDAIQRGLQIVILKALPNSGKTKRLPAQLVRRGRSVLLLAPQVGDLPDVHERLSRYVSCKVSAGQHMHLESWTNEWPQVQSGSQPFGYTLEETGMLGGINLTLSFATRHTSRKPTSFTATSYLSFWRSCRRRLSC